MLCATETRRILALGRKLTSESVIGVAQTKETARRGFNLKAVSRLYNFSLEKQLICHVFRHIIGLAV